MKNRTEQLKQFYDNLPALEDLYVKVSSDYYNISDEFIESLRKVQVKKRELKELNLKTMAEFEREYELSEEYLLIKSCKYQLKGIEKLLQGIMVRIKSLQAQVRGQY